MSTEETLDRQGPPLTPAVLTGQGSLWQGVVSVSHTGPVLISVCALGEPAGLLAEVQGGRCWLQAVLVTACLRWKSGGNRGRSFVPTGLILHLRGRVLLPDERGSPGLSQALECQFQIQS